MNIHVMFFPLSPVCPVCCLSPSLLFICDQFPVLQFSSGVLSLVFLFLLLCFYIVFVSPSGFSHQVMLFLLFCECLLINYLVCLQLGLCLSLLNPNCHNMLAHRCMCLNLSWIKYYGFVQEIQTKTMKLFVMKAEFPSRLHPEKSKLKVGPKKSN